MAEIAAAQVKELREKTGAGMMDCKKALMENHGDLEAAIDWLRKKGLAAAAKKAGRLAVEGLVGVLVQGKWGAIVEVNSETDFVARNEHFQQLVAAIAQAALAQEHTVESLSEVPHEGEAGVTLGVALSRLIAIIGENMNIRRVKRIGVQEGLVASYIHNAASPGLGRIGVLLALESSADESKLAEIGKKLAMHIAAANPQVVRPEEVPAEVLEREKNILGEQARVSGRPEEIIGKMVEGRLRKYYEEVALLEQLYIIDGQSKVSDALAAVAQEIGHPIKIAGFVRFALGEGMDKPQNDFAADVQAQLQH